MFEVVDWERHAARRYVVQNMLDSAPDSRRGLRLRRSMQDGEYLLDCYRGGFVEWDDSAYEWRELWIEIHLRSQLIGAARLREWRLPPFPDPSEFFYWADGYSSEDSLFAEVVCSFWDEVEFPSQFGNIVNFLRLAIDSGRDKEHRALQLLGEFLHIELQRRASVYLLKAFPLEFENVSRGLSNEFQARLSAMHRLYARRLGARPFADQTTYPGFMWRPIRYCPEPATVPSQVWLETEGSP